MELVQQAGAVHVNSNDEIKMRENIDMSETTEKIKALGFNSRERKKSKYMSYPYINIGRQHKSFPAKVEDSMTQCVSHEVESSSVAADHFNGSSSISKSGSKRFRRNWYRKFISWSTMSSSPEFINATSAELLSGLYSIAVNCMFPIENKSFDLVEWFFCRYRLSEYHDEAELAACLVNLKENSGTPVRNSTLNIKTEQKKIRKKKLKNAVKHETKSLSCLSNVNISIAASEFVFENSMGIHTGRPGDKLMCKRNVEEVTPFIQMQNAGTTLNGSSSKCSSVPEDSQVLSSLILEGKAGRKRRKKIVAASEHPSSQIGSGSLDADVKSNKCSSLVIDLQLVSSPTDLTIPEKINGENGELGLITSNPNLSASQLSFVDYNANHRSTEDTKSDVVVASLKMTGHKRRKSIEKAAEEHPKPKFVTGIPDLNGNIIESNSISIFGDVQGLSSQLKSKYNEKRNTKQLKFEQSNCFSAGVGPDKTMNYNRVEANGEAFKTCLLLQFAPGISVPSKEDLLATFCQFGPLHESETQLLKDNGSAQIVFVKSADAGEAFRSIEQNNPFGAKLIAYKLHHFSPISLPVERIVTPSQLSGSKPPPGETPPLDFIRQNLQMMTSMLENSGDNLSPQMRAKLEGEIKNLMDKVNSLASSDSTKL